MSMLLRRYHEAAETTEEQAEAVPTAKDAERLLPDTETDGGKDLPKEAGEPAGNASKADWLAYATAIGISGESLEGMSRDEIRTAVQNVTAD